MSSIEEARLKVLTEFAEAYNRHDADAILAFMSEDCEFLSYTGPDEVGERFVGKVAVTKRVIDGLIAIPGARWVNAVHSVVGDRGFSEWTFVLPQPQGEIRRRGIDVFRFDGDLISSKSTFQKWVIPREAQ